MTGAKIIPPSHQMDYRKLSHVINTPLNGIIGSVELLNIFGGSFEGKEVSELVQATLQSAKELHKLLDNLMQYHYLFDPEEHQKSASKTGFCTNTNFLHEIVYNKSQELGRDADISIEIEAHNCIRISKQHLHKIATELIDNACRYSMNGTPIMIKGKQLDTTYSLQIQDHGQGMSEEQIESIGPFVQFNQQQTGLGLGLFLAKSLVQMYKGTMTIYSRHRVGTTVSVQLPI